MTTLSAPPARERVSTAGSVETVPLVAITERRQFVPFPATRFPAGAAAPVVVLVVSLLVAAVAIAVGVRTPAQRAIAPATVEAQRSVADQVGASIPASVQASSAALTAQTARSASLLASDPRAGLNAVRAAVPEASSLAVLDADDGSVLAGQGEVPGEQARDLVPGRLVLQVAGAVPVAQAVFTARAGAGLRVLATVDVRLPPQPPTDDRHVLLLSGRGEVLDGIGDAPTGRQSDESSVLARVAADVPTAGTGSRGAARGTALVAPGSTRGYVADDATLADPARVPSRGVVSASWTAVGLPALPGSPPVVAVVLSRSTPEVTPGENPALPLAAGLALLALAAGVVLRGVLVAPLQRLRIDGDRAVARGRAPVRRSRVREVDAIAVAFLRSGGRARRRPGIRAAVVVPVVGVVLLAALAAGATFGHAAEAGRSEYVESTRRDALVAGDELRQRLDDGAARVHAAVVPSTGEPAGGDLVARAVALAEPSPATFRSVSVVDRAGSTLFSVGRPPLRRDERVPATDGVEQLNTSGRLPVLAATGWTPDRSYAVVAEYDVAPLLAMVRAYDAHVRVVDPDGRIVLDGRGFAAFSPLPEDALRDAVSSARSGRSVAESTAVDGTPSAVVAEPLGDRDATARLGWTLVASQRLADLDFRRDTASRALLGIAGLASVVVVGALCWCWFGVLRPLRRLGRAVAEGRQTHVVERADEVGALAAALNRRSR